jgi:hypothetical protein
LLDHGKASKDLQKSHRLFMQICMKITSREKQLFLAQLRQYMRERGWNISRLAGESGVNQSQVSRILAGNFKTFGSNIRQLCITIDADPAAYYSGTRTEKDRQRIANSAISIWDGTHRDAEVVIALLREIAKLRKTRREALS